MLDLGIYPLSFASFVLGRPDSVRAVGTKAFTGVDGQVSAVLEAPSGAHAMVNTTLFAKTPTTATISGSLARIEMAGDFYSPVQRHARRSRRPATGVGRQHDHGHQGLCFQASAVARLVADGATESPLLPLAETLSILETADEIRRQVGVVYPGE